MFEAEVTYSRGDYVRAVRFMSRRQITLFIWMLLIGGVVFALLLYRADPSDFEWWAIPAIVALCVFFFVFIRLMQRWNIGRQLKSAPSVKGSQLWAISDEGIKIKGPLSSGDIKWEAIIKVRESNSDFFFYTAKRFAQFLPKRVFSNEQQLADFRRFVIERIGNEAELFEQ